MAASLCFPGCRLCLRSQSAVCPFCLGDWACDQCWQDVQDLPEHVEHDEWLQRMQGILRWRAGEWLQGDADEENARAGGQESDAEGADATSPEADGERGLLSSTEAPESDDLLEEFGESCA